MYQNKEIKTKAEEDSVLVLQYKYNLKDNSFLNQCLVSPLPTPTRLSVLFILYGSTFTPCVCHAEKLMLACFGCVCLSSYQVAKLVIISIFVLFLFIGVR